MSVSHVTHVYQHLESRSDFIFQFSHVLVFSCWVSLMGSCWLGFIFCSSAPTHTLIVSLSLFLSLPLASSIRPSTRWCHLWWRCQRMNPRRRRGRIRSSDKWTLIMMVRGGGGGGVSEWGMNVTVYWRSSLKCAHFNGNFLRDFMSACIYYWIFFLRHAKPLAHPSQDFETLSIVKKYNIYTKKACTELHISLTDKNQIKVHRMIKEMLQVYPDKELSPVKWQIKMFRPAQSVCIVYLQNHFFYVTKQNNAKFTVKHDKWNSFSLSLRSLNKYGSPLPVST